MRRFAMLSVLLLTTATSRGEVVRIIVESRQDVLEGKAFGEVGGYERLVGRVFFAVDPSLAANSSIVDLGGAPRNDDGLVESWANFVVLQPKDPAKRGTALLEVSNRGGKASLSYFNGARGSRLPLSEEDFGDGLLMRRGLTVIWVGWQFDVPDRPEQLRLHVPTLEGITGLVRSDWTVDRTTTRLDIGHRQHRAYPVVEPGSTEHVLTRRAGRLAPREVVPRESWQFIQDGQGKLQEPLRIFSKEGFEGGFLYELVYRAEKPTVVGLGLAAIRDTLAYAKHDEDCPFPVKRGIAVGISQTGRFLRHFLYQGFNIDEAGRPVFDGMLIHTAGAGRGSFNHRFAQPSRDAHRYSAFFYPTDIFPFSGRVQRDPVTGRRDGLLARAGEPRPKIFYTNTGYEYWGRAASLLHTSLDGSADVALLPEERVYHLANTQHFPVGFPPRDNQRIEGAEAWGGNPADLLATERALLVALQDWVERDVAPPPSQHPRIDDETLVGVSELAWPGVPGLEPPRVVHEAYRVDYGPEWMSAGIVAHQPPQLGPAFTTLVPQLDAIGNERGGVPNLESLVPLASYFAWHLRRGLPGGNGELTDFYGTFAPLARSRAGREATSDGRPSIEELYESKEVFLVKVDLAAAQLVANRVLLEEDRTRVHQRAEATWDWIHSDQ